MSAESPAEAFEELRQHNHILRHNVVQLVHEKQVLEDVVARQSAYILELKRRYGLAPHDYEPCRPGLEDVD